MSHGGLTAAAAGVRSGLRAELRMARNRLRGLCFDRDCAELAGRMRLGLGSFSGSTAN